MSSFLNLVKTVSGILGKFLRLVSIRYIRRILRLETKDEAAYRSQVWLELRYNWSLDYYQDHEASALPPTLSGEES